jgi:hypothetical protein
MRPKQKIQLLSIMAVIMTGCAPAGPALDLSEFNEKLSSCYIADNYAAPQCKISQKANDELAYR